jgi:hypothetical protein
VITIPVQGQALRINRTRLVLSGVTVLFVLVTVSSLLLSGAQAQITTYFSSSDRFSIPELNGSIRFAFNGSYSSAKIENNTWVFKDLVLNNSQRLGNLRVSVEDSNITVYSFYSSNAISQTRHSVRYFAEGAGRQVFNLNVNGTTHPSEWWVTITVPNTIFLTEGKDWNLLPDNTVIVNGQTGNITVAHFIFNLAPDYSNVPFLERHSVLLITVGAVAVTVVIASIITVKARRKPHGN